eukprot:CAMPEP_0177768522 /NCGR_PEP_ID=MMETSP0491_2-20121128/9770_1 /TAXON_ID=63592 /ORGANISM="Tetraselmis chuii, Strain PLY429" /LENGTH=243 /DNA_ID=CAMNT_0019285343 /DNA_START=247 /DNA_END=978 /DNA_ORIENTATION=-
MSTAPPSNKLAVRMRIDHLREEDMASEDLGSPKKKHCVVWDEDNLITNEVIKSELNCEKIDEPDTPFVRSPLRSEDDSDEEQERPDAVTAFQDVVTREKVASFAEAGALPKKGARFPEEQASTSKAAAGLPPRSALHKGSAFSEVRSTARADSDLSKDLAPGVPLDVGDSSDAENTEQIHDRRMSNGEPCDLPSEINTSDLPKLMSAAMLEAKRKQHYNMKDALRRGRELLEEEEEDDEEEET